MPSPSPPSAPSWRSPPSLAGCLPAASPPFSEFALVNVASYGRVLPPDFSAGRISPHPAYLQALAANLVSPARGLLVFSPVVALSVAGLGLQVRRRTVVPLDVVAAGCVTAQLLVVSAQNEGCGRAMPSAPAS